MFCKLDPEHFIFDFVTDMLLFCIELSGNVVHKEDPWIQQNHPCIFECIEGYIDLAQYDHTSGCNIIVFKGYLYQCSFICTLHCNQECREAIGGQGLKTENRVGQLKSEFDVQSTFEGIKMFSCNRYTDCFNNYECPCNRRGLVCYKKVEQTFRALFDMHSSLSVIVRWRWTGVPIMNHSLKTDCRLI